MKNHGVEYALGLGDYAYTTGQSAVDSWWQKIINAGLNTIWKGSLGNHDVSDSSRYLSKFGSIRMVLFI